MKSIRTARGSAVRLTARLEASGVQTTTRNAHINVEGVSHSKTNIVLLCVATIAAKARIALRCAPFRTQALTGAYDMTFFEKRHFLETTGFVLAPDGAITGANMTAHNLKRPVQCVVGNCREVQKIADQRRAISAFGIARPISNQSGALKS